MRRAQVMPVVLLLVFAGFAYRLHVVRQDSQADAAAGERSAAVLANAAWKPRAAYGRRLEPAGQTVLFGAGQSDETSFNALAAAVAPAKPQMMMRYVDLRDDLPRFFVGLTADLARHDSTLLPQIGLSLNRGEASRHYEAETARGADDAHVVQLCRGLRALRRPAFLRIGYEFNGRWNGYEAMPYVAAFRRIANAVHACANVAVVWDWSPDAEIDVQQAGAPAQFAAARWEEFYPGDASVDWWGLNLFTPRTMTMHAANEFLQAAAAKRMPVMIAESTLRGASIADTQRAIATWFAPYFGLIRATPGVKAFCYIDWDWRRYPQWADWGDARVESNPPVAAYVRAQVQRIAAAN